MVIIGETILIVGTLIFLGVQIWVERDNAKKELRSYISVQLAYDFPIESGKINKVPLRIVNAGQTPAYKMALHARGFQATPGKAVEWEWAFAPKENIREKIGYLPDVAYRTFDTDYPITASDLAPGQLHLFVVGIAYYNDIYDKPHWVTFCMWWSRESFAPDRGTYCDKYNETDETQPTPPKDQPIVVR